MTDPSDPQTSPAAFEKARAGDRAALEALVVAHLPHLRAFLRVRMSPALRARESCSDLAQSVCLGALRGLDRLELRSEPEFRAWLFRAARNRLKQRDRNLRAARRDPAREVDLPPEDLAKVYASITPSRVAASREFVESFERAFDALTIDQREAIALCRIARLTASEAGVVMERSEDAVRKLLGRGLFRLAKLLDSATIDPATDEPATDESANPS